MWATYALPHELCYMNYVRICLSFFIALVKKWATYTIHYESCWNLSVTFHCSLDKNMGYICPPPMTHVKTCLSLFIAMVKKRATYTTPYESCWNLSVTFHCSIDKKCASYMLPQETELQVLAGLRLAKNKFFLTTWNVCLLFKLTLTLQDLPGLDEINACANCLLGNRQSGRNVNNKLRKKMHRNFVTLHKETDQIKVCHDSLLLS